jgi:quinol monooxygenase YgiN
VTVVSVFVDLQVEPARREEFDRLIRVHAYRARTEEAGCLDFAVHQDVADANHYLLFSSYKDQASFEFHRDKQEMAEFKKAAAGLYKQNRTVWTTPLPGA